MTLYLPILTKVRKALLLLIQFSMTASFSFQTFAQTPVIQWQKTLGGTDEDLGSHSIIKTADNGLLTGGVVKSKDGDGVGNHGGQDLLVTKLTNAGTIQWKKLLGGGKDERGCFLLQAKDGGYLVAGATFSNNGDVFGNHGGFDVWIVKLDGAGVIQWKKTIGGAGNEEIIALRENSSGEILIGGTTYASGTSVSGTAPPSDFIVAKLSASGTLLWQKAFGGSGTETMNQLQVTADGGCIAVGMTSSADGPITGFHGGGRDTWAIKLSASGDLQWQRALGGSGDEYYCAVQVTTLNGAEGYVIAVRTNSIDGDVAGNHGNNDIWVVKVNSDGAIQWRKTFGGSKWEELGTIKATKDGGFIIGATTQSSDGNVTGQHGGGDAWMVKIDANGTLQWQKTLGGTASDEIMGFQQTTDGGYIVNVFDQSNDGDGTGFHGKVDVLLVKLDPNGNVQWKRCLGGSNEEWPLNRNSFPYNQYFTTYATAHDENQMQASDGNYVFMTSTISNDGDVQGLHYSARTGLRYDNWVVKVAPPTAASVLTTVVNRSTLASETRNEDIFAYPNPFKYQTTVRFVAAMSGRTTLDLFDAGGAKVRTLFDRTVQAGEVYTVPIFDILLSKGVYFYILNNDYRRTSGRLVKD